MVDPALEAALRQVRRWADSHMPDARDELRLEGIAARALDHDQGLPRWPGQRLDQLADCTAALPTAGRCRRAVVVVLVRPQRPVAPL